MADNKKMSYQEALTELKKLVELVEDPQRDISTLTADVKKATELAKFCRDYLRKNEEELTEIING